MPTLQIADKPTLDEINNKIDEISTLLNNNDSMRVPIAYGRNYITVNNSNSPQNIYLAGKGTMWFGTELTENQNCKIIIDGTTVFDGRNAKIFDTFFQQSTSYANLVPFDFEKSINITLTSTTSTAYYAYYHYQLYK